MVVTNPGKFCDHIYQINKARRLSQEYWIRTDTAWCSWGLLWYEVGVWWTRFAGHSDNINDSYLAGISITIGDLWKHVWSYAVGHDDQCNTPNRNCPCTTYPGPDPPVFVGNDNYCESGNDVDQFPPGDKFYTDDPLWDGERHLSNRNNCCVLAGLPWFSQQFPIPQQEDVEKRLCQLSAFTKEAVPIQLSVK